MDKFDKKMNMRVEYLDMEGVVNLLRKWDLGEFEEFAMEKHLDGRKLADVTEGIVKLWRPKSNANKLILFVQDLKMNPAKYLDKSKKDRDTHMDTIIEEHKISVTETPHIEMEEVKTVSVIRDMPTADAETKTPVETTEAQYQTVKKKKDNNFSAFNNVEELIKKIVPAKSFLYRNQGTKEASPSYLPMDAGTPKKRKLFRISGYDYPSFDLRRFSKQDFGDRGYYPMKRNSRFFIQKSKPPEGRPKYKSLSSTEELKYPEDHFYEDLCYNDVANESRHSVPIQNVKPYRVKIQELFQSIKIPFFRRGEEAIQEKEDKNVDINEKESNFYENSDGIVNMYDSVHVNTHVKEPVNVVEKPKLPVEDYLEPVQLNKDYCDINYQRQKDDSLLGYIMSIFETRFGMRRETNDGIHSEDSEDDKNNDEARRWSEDQKPKTNMADRPLPVPVENEPYYMDIDRTEAENMLRGQPDGTFVLRPSSQPNHAYTISVSCSNGVHNVGVRRRSDGRLSLGFARRGERSFADVTSMLRHHRKRRLLLVANGGVLGATTLNESPEYYQTPCNIPVKVLI